MAREDTRIWPVILSMAACLAAPAPVPAAVIDADPSDYLRRLAHLEPGDTLVLAPGTYRGGLSITNLGGTAERPIVIRGPDDQSAVFTASDCCNTVQLRNTNHVLIRGLTLDGAGTRTAFAVDSRGPCHDITLERLKIVNFGANQQAVGISTKGPAWNWTIRHNTIVGAGTGLYLGNSDGSAPFVNGVIEYNVVLDTVGYNLQIKHQRDRPSGIGLPTGFSRTIIRHNVWSKQHGALGGANARPNVLVGHFPLRGVGSTDRYEIYGNFFYQNPTEALFQGEGNIVLHDNVFVNPAGPAIHIRPHNDEPRAITIYHNTVVASGAGIELTGASALFVQKIIANASFAGIPITGSGQVGNVTGTIAQAADHLNAPHAPIESLDLYPRPGKLSGPEPDLSQFDEFVDGRRDFNGRVRRTGMRGAYCGAGSNPGWHLARLIKQTPVGPEPGHCNATDHR